MGAWKYSINCISSDEKDLSRNWWVSLYKYAVNLGGGVNLNCIDVYAVLESKL